MKDCCQDSGCRAEADLTYLGRGICACHWDSLTADDRPIDALTRALGISAATAATTEDPMPETKKTESKSKKDTKTKAAVEPKPKREKAPKEDLCVFACRVAEAERNAFHAAAGPAGASHFARKLMVVFAAEDEAGFRTLLKEAKEARQ
jgi:hypothetical protein